MACLVSFCVSHSCPNLSKYLWLTQTMWYLCSLAFSGGGNALKHVCMCTGTWRWSKGVLLRLSSVGICSGGEFYRASMRTRGDKERRGLQGGGDEFKASNLLRINLKRCCNRNSQKSQHSQMQPVDICWRWIEATWVSHGWRMYWWTLHGCTVHGVQQLFPGSCSYPKSMLGVPSNQPCLAGLM
jgi:hypothetical protein